MGSKSGLEVKVEVSEGVIKRLINDYLIKHLKATDERIVDMHLVCDHKKRTFKVVANVTGPK